MRRQSTLEFSVMLSSSCGDKRKRLLPLQLFPFYGALYKKEVVIQLHIGRGLRSGRQSNGIACLQKTVSP
uniref:Uncharacterized protein n=1 Tax=Panagrellus redivivus TaxID=6233 RepID=A0A7E4VZ26_PANRE